MQEQPKPIVFISYGHPEKPIVDKIAGYLRGRGIRVLMDRVDDNASAGESGVITPGSDWREKLGKAIAECDGVIACLSEHSTRAGGVCLDELATESTLHGGNFLTVLLDDKAKLKPLGPALHRQWFDMSAWKQYWDGSCFREPDFSDWFVGVAAKLADSLEHPDFADFHDDIEKIRAHLGKPIQPNRLLDVMNGDLVGRAWLADEIKSWLAEKNPAPLFAVYAGPGMGKSMLAAHMTKNSLLTGRYAYGWAFCDIEGVVDGRRALKSLAASLAMNLPEYRVNLRELLIGRGAVDLDALTLDELARHLISEPLSIAIDGGHDPVLLVVDAVDKACSHGEDGFALALSSLAQRLPSWVQMVVTSTNTEAVRSAFEQYPCAELKTDDPRNLEDIRQYLAQCAPDLTDGGRSAVLDACGGTIWEAELIVDMLRGAAQSTRLDLGDDAAVTDALKSLPPGLTGKFRGIIAACSHAADFRSRWRLAFGCLLSRPGLPTEELRRALGWDFADAWDLCTVFEAFVTTGGSANGHSTGLLIRHNHMAEWLAQDQAGAYRAFSQDGSKVLGQMCLDVASRGTERLTRWEIANIEPLLEEARLHDDLAVVRADETLLKRMLDEVPGLFDDDPDAGRDLLERCLAWPSCRGFVRARALEQHAAIFESLSLPSMGIAPLKEAIAIYEEGHVDDENPLVARAFAHCLAKLAELLVKVRDPETRLWCERACDQYDLVPLHDDGCADEFAQALNWMAIHLRFSKNPDDQRRSLDYFEKALAMRERLFAGDGNRFGGGYAWTLNSYATFLFDKDPGDPRSHDLLGKAVNIRKERAERLGDVGSLADYSWSLGSLIRQRGNGDRSSLTDDYEELVELRQKLVRENPGRFKRDLAWAVGRFAFHLWHTPDGDRHRAAELYGQAAELWRELARVDRARSAADLANLLDRWSMDLELAGDSGRAATLRDEARRAYLSYAKANRRELPEEEGDDAFVARIRKELVRRAPAQYLSLD